MKIRVKLGKKIISLKRSVFIVNNYLQIKFVKWNSKITHISYRLLDQVTYRWLDPIMFGALYFYDQKRYEDIKYERINQSDHNDQRTYKS